MKISNSELNKALKKLLQHSLGSHAVAPRPAIDANIYQALHHKRTAKARSRRRLNRMGKIGVVFLLGLSIALLIGPVNQTSTRLLNRVMAVAQQIPTQLLSHRAIKQTSVQPVAKSIITDSIGASHFTALRPDRQAKVAANQSRERLSDSRLTKELPEKRQIVSLTEENETYGLHEASRVAPSRSHQRLVRLNTKRNRKQPITLVGTLGSTKRGNQQVGVKQSQSSPRGTYLAEQENLVQTAGSSSTSPIRKLATIKPITVLSFAHRLTEPAVQIISPSVLHSQTKSGRQLTFIEKTDGLHWLISVTPLTTRQRVILLPTPEARVQDVRFPKGLTQSVGYKMNMGVEKKGFQLLLSYTQLQMRSDYAYSTDQYVVEENGSQYSVKRIGTPATTTTTLHLAGVAVRKQLDVNNHLLGRFFATVGLDYSRSLASVSQGFLFVSATAGKTIRLSPEASLYIGPYVDYSFTRIQPIDQLQIRPYQAGLSFAFKLGQHTH